MAPVLGWGGGGVGDWVIGGVGAWARGCGAWLLWGTAPIPVGMQAGKESNESVIGPEETTYCRGAYTATDWPIILGRAPYL